MPDDHPSQLGGGEIEIKLLLVHALYNYICLCKPAARARLHAVVRVCHGALLPCERLSAVDSST